MNPKTIIYIAKLDVNHYQTKVWAGPQPGSPGQSLGVAGRGSLILPGVAGRGARVGDPPQPCQLWPGLVRLGEAVKRLFDRPFKSCRPSRPDPTPKPRTTI